MVRGCDGPRDSRDGGGGFQQLRAPHPFVDHRELLLEPGRPAALIRAVAAPPAPYNGPEEIAFYPTAQDVEDALVKLTRQ